MDRGVTPSRLIVGNRLENGVERIQFIPPEELIGGYRYLILNKPNGEASYPVPLDHDGFFYVDSNVTYVLEGIWVANFVTTKSEIDQNQLNPESFTFISDDIILVVKKNRINKAHLDDLPLPVNLQIVYDQLFNTYEQIKSDYDSGAFNGKDGKSAYELAVENGFEGTEKEWLESLRYDHSDEFEKLAEQVKLDANSAADSATKAENAMNEANTTAQENVEAINQASTNAQNAITTTKDNAIQAVSDEQTEAVQAIESAQSTAETAINAKQAESVQAVETAKEEATKAIETGKTEAVTAIETAKDEAIEEIENTGVPLEDIEKLAIKETTTGDPTIISDSADWRLQKLNVYGQSEQDGTPTPENPVEIISKEVSEIKVIGRNILNPQRLSVQNIALKKGTVLTILTKDNIPSLGVNVHGQTAKGENVWMSIDAGKTKSVVTLQNDIVSFKNELEPGVEHGLFIGDTDIYEPYKEQVVNLTSPITLRGIPVSSGGNVTIDGQQYVSDVICEKDGVIGVDRNIAEQKLNGTESWTIDTQSENTTRFYTPSSSSSGSGLVSVCNYLSYNLMWSKDEEGTYVDTNSIVFRVDKTTVGETQESINQWLQGLNPKLNILNIQISPTFEPLPEEVQAQYKALKSYYPNTVIQTGCWNEVEYIADTKMYIDKQVTALSEAMLER